MMVRERCAVFYRQTLGKPIERQGVGLHSGVPVTLRLVPAEAGSGVVFVRTDLGGAELPATLEHAGPSFYATVLRCMQTTAEAYVAAHCAVAVQRGD